MIPTIELRNEPAGTVAGTATESTVNMALLKNQFIFSIQSTECFDGIVLTH